MILLLSLVLRVVALIWSIVLMRKLREWRMGFLTAMIALMGPRGVRGILDVCAAGESS